jgi:hypothetical protein
VSVWNAGTYSETESKYKHNKHNKHNKHWGVQTPAILTHTSVHSAFFQAPRHFRKFPRTQRWLNVLPRSWRLLPLPRHSQSSVWTPIRPRPWKENGLSQCAKCNTKTVSLHDLALPRKLLLIWTHEIFPILKFKFLTCNEKEIYAGLVKPTLDFCQFSLNNPFPTTDDKLYRQSEDMEKLG